MGINPGRAPEIPEYLINDFRIRKMFEENLEVDHKASVQSKKPLNFMSHNKIVSFIVAVVVTMIGLAIAFPWKTLTVEPGFTGVIVDKPYFFGNEGVRMNDVLVEGRMWAWKSTDVIPVINTPYKQPVRIDDFSTADNYLVDFDSTVSLRITNAPQMVSKWKLTFWSETVLAEYNSIVRREVSKNTLYKLMSDSVTLSDMDDEITKKLTNFITTRGIPVAVEGVALGRAKPTTAVLAQLDETARQTEQSKTNIQKAAAELQRKTAEENRAAADVAYSNKIGLSPSQFTQLRIAELQAGACIRANNCVIGIDRITPASK